MASSLQSSTKFCHRNSSRRCNVQARLWERNTFPKMNPATDEQVQEAFCKDQQTREERDADANLTRRRDSFQLGDQVITKNNGHTKFQPKFGPDPKTVIAIGEGGVTCRGTHGTVQRRHQDDVKLAPSPAPTTTPIQEPPGQAPSEEAAMGRGDSGQSASVLEESNLGGESKRPSRNRKPNPRYNANEFHLY